ncbi:MAG: archease [Acidobacteria bacterium]|nr:archease [Acidobacteriota bacterium]
MPYRFLEDVATADIAFEAWGEDLEDLFISAAEATLNVMVEDLESIQPLERRELSVEADAIDMLLFNLLQEIIYFKDSEKLLLRIGKVKIKEKSRKYFAEAVANGEFLDPERHRTRVDVKAVTLHRFAVEETKEGWKSSVILDI